MVLILPMKLRNKTIDRWLSKNDEHNNETIRRQRRMPKKIRMDGHGRYRCFKCQHQHNWTSHEASVLFDISGARYCDIRVAYAFAQKCSKCNTSECRPAFTKDDWLEMIERLCNRIRNWTANPPLRGGRQGGPKPHLADKCEACGWGKTPLRSHVGGAGN